MADKLGLVLMGGGARAAYQVGAMQAISQWYPRIHQSPFSIYSGTSAGAINATAIACYNSSFRLGVKKLHWLWSRLHSENILVSSPTGVSKHIMKQWLARVKADYYTPPPFSLLDNSPLLELLNEVVNYRRLEQQIATKQLDALAINTSSYYSGKSVCFYQGNEDIQPWDRPRAKGRRARINNEFLLASSAIPLIFPAQKLNQHYYGDGSIHQLAPLQPAIRMGAEKILIIDQTTSKLNKQRPQDPPGLAKISGHLMDAVFSDTLSADHDNLLKTNKLLAEMPKQVRKHASRKEIETFILSPSVSFDRYAVGYYPSLPPAVRGLLTLLGISPKDDAALTSYLLFEPDYIKALINIGFTDAMNRETELRAFLKI
ncbi:patatin-like phospholipase family protein [Vibrio sp. SS-MA-C1-2]|uniref:patatin-like phospholipase family protein n=1 Tax=Vibrio sp. SS-MA-C1-2 TaxID=2908646 RepID=UPI001F448847|nr:patatin-like phospholipase family protein [Vibrio sp. SS-MA-C1-2]UJF18883.1 patatin-like phospholipase family protein [Vibrio sp. SS-MA-C1-2]